MITDIDELLEKEAYRTKIDKIKTISATFMGASGLQNQREVALDAINGTAGQTVASNRHSLEKKSHNHLESMIDFCLDIQKVVEDFNANLLWFRYLFSSCYDSTLCRINGQQLE